MTGQNMVREAKLPRGTCKIHVFGALEDRSRPIVFLFMDAFGPRPTLFRIGDWLAAEGYRVLLPDLFYEHAPYVLLDPQSLFSGGEDRQRLMHFLAGLDQDALDGDVGALLAWCAPWLDEGVPIGATGYCMGGRYALTAATLDNRVALAACFHASTLAPEQGESAHRRLSGTRARIYAGIAEFDPTFDAAEEGRLAAALREAGSAHIIESYAGAAHGFVMDDLPVYHPAAAEHHKRRLSEQLRESFYTRARAAG